MINNMINIEKYVLISVETYEYFAVHYHHEISDPEKYIRLVVIIVNYRWQRWCME